MNQNKKLSNPGGTARSPRIVTIGVYGFDEESFFNTLQETGVDTFCDIRQRRGVRGARYAFANSKRLQARLHDLGIHYHHAPELAPTAEIRSHQREADQTNKIAKRKRTALDESFIEAYQKGILNAFDAESFLQQLGGHSRVIVLFCVEKEPEACHRSLVAAELEQALGLEVTHKTPPSQL